MFLKRLKEFFQVETSPLPSKDAIEKSPSERESRMTAVADLMASLPPAAELPRYPPYKEWPNGSVTGYTVVKGDADKVAKALLEEWELKIGYKSMHPYDSDASGAVAAIGSMVANRESSCAFSWGVNSFHFSLHKDSGALCMLVKAQTNS